MEITDKKLGYGIIIFLVLFFITLFSYIYFLFFQGQYDMTVKFPNLGILAKDDAVKIYGKQVGRVKTIERKNDSAFVTLEMWVPVHLKKDYIINERDRGLMGDREIQMLPGTPGGQEIDVSVPITGTFVPGISENMAAANNLKKKINELHVYIAELAYGNDGKKSFPNQFRDVLNKLDEVSQKLETLIINLQDPVNNGVVSLNKVSKDAHTVSTSAIKSADDLIVQLEKTLVQLDTIIAKAGPALDTVGGIADRMLTDSTLVARTFRKTSFLDTLAQSVESLHKELLLMRKKGHLNINLF